MRLYSTSASRSGSVSSTTSSLDSRHALYMSQSDLKVLKNKFQFLRDDDADAEQGETDWQIRMSVRYYQQLFREYALADLSRYNEGKIGLRWRTEAEVVTGKGQFICGNKRCDERTQLHSYELLFVYVEHGEQKKCLVKVRMCTVCAEKLFFKKLSERRRQKARGKETRGRKRRRMEKRGGYNEREKRRRRSTSCFDSDSSEESVIGNASEQTEARLKECSGIGADTSPGIHEICAMINAEQNAKYPRSLTKHSNDFDELLP